MTRENSHLPGREKGYNRGDPQIKSESLKLDSPFLKLRAWSYLLSLKSLLGRVTFLGALIYLIEEAKLHQKPLRRLANTKLIGLGIFAPSVLFGLSTTVQVLSNPETFFGSLPTMGLWWLGTWVGLEIVFPTPAYL